MTVSVEPDGLRLAVMALFRPGHPPVLIPWAEIPDVRPRKVLWVTQYVLDVGEPRVTTVALPEHVVQAIAEAGVTGLPGPSAA